MNFPIKYKNSTFYISLKGAAVKTKLELFKLLKVPMEDYGITIGNIRNYNSLIADTTQGKFSFIPNQSQLYNPDKDDRNLYLVNELNLNPDTLEETFGENPPNTIIKEKYVGYKTFMQSLEDMKVVN